MAAFIVVDPDESSYLEPSYIDNARDDNAAVFRAPVQVGPAVKRKLCGDFDEAASSSGQETVLLPVPSVKETIQIYLRVKPKTLEESEISSSTASSGIASGGIDSTPDNSATEPDDLISIESEHQVALNAPKESNTYKNSVNGAGTALLHRFAFTKIFPPDTTQHELFQEMVLPRMRDLMEGQNQLLFTYGATSSGKTYTVQGSSGDPGILPRALDVIFNSIGDRQMLTLALKPNCFNRVVQMKEKDVRRLEEDKQGVFRLGLELAAQEKAAREQRHYDASKMSGISKLTEESFNAADMTNLTQDSLQAMFPDLAGRTVEATEIAIRHSDINYAVWISFAEIYNESIFDLLEKIPQPKRKGDRQPKRNPLKLAEDKNGSIYVKGLKEVKVNSANEAYQVMMIGRANLHFAATRLNHHSSRSHCIFTIKVIRVAETAKPHLARVSMLSFCDLAGSERIKKTLNTGERQKEAGNINTSLLVLGRCMKAIRHNQQSSNKDSRRKLQVPYRESKLTRMFQPFLEGHGKASMVVNVSQAPYLFDESVQVLKFAAVTSKITVVQLPEPAPVPETSPATVIKQPAAKQRKRQTRFSMMVENHHKPQRGGGGGSSTLMGRGSIAWEMPAARSTMCPVRGDGYGDETLMEEEEQSVMDTTVVTDQRYENLLKLIEDLKNQLIKEKQEKLIMEKEIRTELCDEFNNMLVEIESSWERRLQDERERTEELQAWRINKVQEVYRAQRNKRKREEEPEGSPNETAAFQQAELEIQLEEKVTELRLLEEKLAASQEQQAAAAKREIKQQEELTKKLSELKREKEAREKLEEEKNELVMAARAKEEAEKSESTDPIIEDLKRQVQAQKEQLEEVETKNKSLKELLDEAGEDFMEKRRELEKATETLQDREKHVLELKVHLNEVTAQLEEARELLSDSANRMEEKEKALEAAEEALEEAELKVKSLEAAANTAAEAGQKVADAKKRAEEAETRASDAEGKLKEAGSDRDRVERELNDEIEALKASKKKLKAQLEEKAGQEKEAHEREVTKLEGEVKSLIQAEKQQRTASEEAASEVAMLRKQLKELNAKLAQQKGKDAKEREQELKERDNQIEKLNIQVSSLRKEERALEVVTDELHAQTKEKEHLREQVEMLKDQVEATGYDLTKMKEERDTMMATYEQRLKKTTEELSMEKREAIKMRKVMSQSTPTKLACKRDAAEVLLLRDELMKKTEFIKHLESMIPSKKELRYPASSESEDEPDRPVDLVSQVARLEKELEQQRSTHSREMDKVKKASQEMVNMYKETNLALQRQAASASTSIATDHSTLEADESNASAIEDTPSASNRKRRRKNTASGTGNKSRRGRKAANAHNKTDSASQASFEDSNVENDEPPEQLHHQQGQEEAPAHQPLLPRRSARVKRSSTRPSRKNSSSTSSSTAPAPDGDESHSQHHYPLRDAGNGGPLDAIRESSEDGGSSSTPGRSKAGGKRQLYNDDKEAQQFTPPPADMLAGQQGATPRTAIKRQLRSRSSRKKN